MQSWKWNPLREESRINNVIILVGREETWNIMFQMRADVKCFSLSRYLQRETEKYISSSKNSSYSDIISNNKNKFKMKKYAWRYSVNIILIENNINIQ